MRDKERVIIIIDGNNFYHRFWYYLKGTNYKLALIVNFGSQKLQIKRWIYDKAREKYK